MTYLIDSDVLADYLQGIPQAVDLLTRLPDQGLAISLITFGEIYEGIYFGRDPKRSEQVFRQVLRGVTVLPLNQAIMKRFARIRGELRQRGQIIGDPDILIAATALYHDLTLVTRNHRHYQRVPGLQLHPQNR